MAATGIDLEAIQRPGLSVANPRIRSDRQGGAGLGRGLGPIVKWPDAAQTYLLVVDDPNGQFHVINRADGKLLSSWGRVGHQIGEFYNLHFIGLDSKGHVYSGEVQGKRVQKFRNVGGL